MICPLSAVLACDDLHTRGDCPLSGALILLAVLDAGLYDLVRGALEVWGVETFTLADLRERAEEAQVLRALLKILTDHEEESP